eukprot:2742901-Rhodomonas_salina.1
MIQASGHLTCQAVSHRGHQPSLSLLNPIVPQYLDTRSSFMMTYQCPSQYPVSLFQGPATATSAGRQSFLATDRHSHPSHHRDLLGSTHPGSHRFTGRCSHGSLEFKCGSIELRLRLCPFDRRGRSPQTQAPSPLDVSDSDSALLHPIQLRAVQVFLDPSHHHDHDPQSLNLTGVESLSRRRNLNSAPPPQPEAHWHWHSAAAQRFATVTPAVTVLEPSSSLPPGRCDLTELRCRSPGGLSGPGPGRAMPGRLGHGGAALSLAGSVPVLAESQTRLSRSRLTTVT